MFVVAGFCSVFFRCLAVVAGVAAVLLLAPAVRCAASVFVFGCLAVCLLLLALSFVCFG